MKRMYQLSSGLLVRMDVADCVRAAVFRTGIDEHPYCTSGGTVSLFNYQGAPYAITCKHILGSGVGRHEWSDLVVPHGKHLDRGSRVQAVHCPTECWGHALHTDLVDLAIIKLGPPALLGRYEDQLFVVDDKTVCTSSVGDVIAVHGVLYDPTWIEGDGIAPAYCALKFYDIGNTLSDTTLRTAKVTLRVPPNISNLAGLSGGIAYNETKNGVAGIVVRGSLRESKASVHYLNMAYVLSALRAVHDRSERADYHSLPPDIARNT